MTDKSLIELLLPEGILEYFDIIKYIKQQEGLHLYLVEKNISPVEYSSDKLISKGFMDEITVQDFPIRGKASYLHIKRRRWINIRSGDIICRNWTMVAKGTRMTQEFASFLKAIA